MTHTTSGPPVRRPEFIKSIIFPFIFKFMQNCKFPNPNPYPDQNKLLTYHCSGSRSCSRAAVRDRRLGRLFFLLGRLHIIITAMLFKSHISATLGKCNFVSRIADRIKDSTLPELLHLPRRRTAKRRVRRRAKRRERKKLLPRTVRKLLPRSRQS